MAMVVFTTFQEAHRFVQEHNGKSIMGGQITCCHDPYFALLSHRYEDVTGEKMRTPIHLKNLDEGILMLRRRQLFVKGNPVSHHNPASSSTQPIVEPNQEEDMDMESPSGSDAESQDCDMRKPEQCSSMANSPTSMRKPYTDDSSHMPRNEPSLLNPPLIPPLPSLSGVPPPTMSPSFPADLRPSQQSRSDALPLTSPLPPLFPAPQRLDATSIDEKATTSVPQPLGSPLHYTRGKRNSHGRQHKRKKKKRKRHSSYSSSSDSSSISSLNIGEYLRVEKKESTKSKYISREGEGQEKTIVEEIKTITKKKYRVRESKWSGVKQTTGLQTISSDESVGGFDYAGEDNKKKVAFPSKPNEREKKVEGHRWSTSSTESDVEQYRKIDQKNDKLLTTSSLPDIITSAPASCTTAPPPSTAVFASCPPFPPIPPAGVVIPPPPLAVSQPVSASAPPFPLMPPFLPPPGFPLPHVNPPPVGPPLFGALLPPPGFPLPLPQSHAKPEPPKVALRFVENSPRQATPSAPFQQTIADRVASIFGNNSFSGAASSRVGSRAVKRPPSRVSACGNLDVIDLDKVPSKSPTGETAASCAHSEVGRVKSRQGRIMHKMRHNTSDKLKNRFVKKVNFVREATERSIGEEIVDVVTKDFYKRIEVVSFEILEEVLAELRHELEEQKRNEAQEALRAQAQQVTPEKPSDFAQLVSPLAAGLNGAPEKLGTFPFTINMPKLPSFRRKIRPPSPESESSKSPDDRNQDSGSDYSDAAQKSSSSSHASNSPNDFLTRKRRSRRRCRSLYARSNSLSQRSSSRDSKSFSVKSSQSAISTQKESVSIASTGVSTASSIASSSQSLASSDDEDRDVSTATEEQYIPVLGAEECQKTEVKVEERPLWERIINGSSLEWSESLPRALYHVNLTEHCYFKLFEVEEDLKLGIHETLPRTEHKVLAVPKKARPTKLAKHERELLSLLPTIEAHVPSEPQMLYPPWSEEDRKRHIHDVVFDPEDQEYLKQAWLALQPSGENVSTPPWTRPLRFNFFSWSDKPRLLDKPMKKGRLDLYFADSELDGILPIEGGCARTRGYFKMSLKEKRKLIRRPEDEQHIKTVINDRDEAAVRHNLIVTKESRSMHRRLLTTMGDTNTDFFKSINSSIARR
ncbi:hypothetical protein KIN20_027217 [Parelaphostrongylus tenuis]|uniref:COMPASS complex Set1 subunit N-SET domain-containing protein n=1 Tax=Parelaphostrongylus tenuis TaxID=148309 RepID=A0AAD5QZA0_PARTN|nr:hypothetical protein KIN20_027217 [Parelaphostrongylus tenuis]